MSVSGRPSLLMWMEYVTSSPNSKKFGPPGGYSSGMKLARIVTVSGLSGLTNAYRSVLSATGSLAILGASRCDVTNLFSCAHFFRDECCQPRVLGLDDGLSVHHGDLVAADGGDNWFGVFVCSGCLLRGLPFGQGDLAHKRGSPGGDCSDPYSELQEFSS